MTQNGYCQPLHCNMKNHKSAKIRRLLKISNQSLKNYKLILDKKTSKTIFTQGVKNNIYILHQPKPQLLMYFGTCALKALVGSLHFVLQSHFCKARIQLTALKYRSFPYIHLKSW